MCYINGLLLVNVTTQYIVKKERGKNLVQKFLLEKYCSNTFRIVRSEKFHKTLHFVRKSAHVQLSNTLGFTHIEVDSGQSIRTGRPYATIQEISR